MNYVKKYGKEAFHREILQMCDSRAEAFSAEKITITEAVLNDDKCLNLIQGGVGYAHEYNETFRDRISNTRNHRLQNGIIIPKKHTEEHKQKLREDNPGGKATAKPVCQVDSNTGVVTLWGSARAAGIALGVKQWRNISTAVRNPHQTVGGFYWRWPDDSNIVDGVLVGVEELNSVRCDNAMRAGKQVQQIDTEGNLLIAWKNMSEASRGTGVKTANISAAVKSGKKAGGYYWKLQ